MTSTLSSRLQTALKTHAEIFTNLLDQLKPSSFALMRKFLDSEAQVRKLVAEVEILEHEVEKLCAENAALRAVRTETGETQTDKQTNN